MKCKIVNRSPGSVSYYIDSTRTTRTFQPGVPYTVDYAEIEEVCKQPGGKELVYNYLYIDKMAEIAEELNINPQPEYYIPENEIDNWMQTCDLDAFKDALDYAPEGMKDIIKQHAVQLPLTDMQKCNAIKDQLGFDVIMAIRNEEATKEEDEAEKNQERDRTGRRIPVDKTPTPPAVQKRRTTPKYNVVKREGE